MKQYALVIKQDQLSHQIASKIKTQLDAIMEYDQENPDLVISVGGDGTMLLSVHQYLSKDVNFLGVHTGTLGFFTDFRKDEITKLVEAIKNDCYHLLARNLLEIKVKHEKKEDVYFALNEMRIDYGYTTQVIDVYINDELLEVFRGNGLCVSTPAGSTAYNKSIGGAVIYPGTPLMQLTEVAGIQHNAYRSLGSSLVLDASNMIKLIGHNFEQVYLGIDHLSYQIKDVDSIEIKIAKKTINFIEYEEKSFVQRIRRAFING
ncbi:MAG: NAD kinase [[Clostridium] spiroforme]|uniref:NAD kinase n=1 Tax=Thomasclavelia spiroformis TaxID=29348 RepID=A0A943EN30_9FIRM|nr:NAD kinase [Thomasclavelia spiroformis]MBS5587420.1 NAD kinase [Thomasclavelia spiroformis]